MQNIGERTLKAQRKELPQIDAQFSFPEPGSKESLQMVNKLLDRCLRFYTLNQIAAHVGLTPRALSYMRHSGIHKYPHQLALEILAGDIIITDRHVVWK